MTPIDQFIALVTCGLFTGAALYINLVEHPARLECGVELAARVFGPSYRRAARLQGALAVVSALAAGAAWWRSADPIWLLGSALIFSVVPLTLLAIMPTNKKLLSEDIDGAAAETRALLVRWGRLHAIRSAAGLVAFILFAARTASG